MLIYITLILLVITEAASLPIYYWLPLDVMIVIGMIIIGYIKFESTKHQMLIAMYLMLQAMILMGRKIDSGIMIYLVEYFFCINCVFVLTKNNNNLSFVNI